MVDIHKAAADFRRSIRKGDLLHLLTQIVSTNILLPDQLCRKDSASTAGTLDPDGWKKMLSENKLQEGGISLHCRKRGIMLITIFFKCDFTWPITQAARFSSVTPSVQTSMSSPSTFMTQDEDLPDQVMEGEQGWVMQGVLSPATQSRLADLFTAAAVPGRSVALDVCGLSQRSRDSRRRSTSAYWSKLFNYRRKFPDLRNQGIHYRPLVWTADGRPSPGLSITGAMLSLLTVGLVITTTQTQRQIRPYQTTLMTMILLPLPVNRLSPCNRQPSSCAPMRQFASAFLMYPGDLELDALFEDHGVSSAVSEDMLALDWAVHQRCTLGQLPLAGRQRTNRQKCPLLLGRARCRRRSPAPRCRFPSSNFGLCSFVVCKGRGRHPHLRHPSLVCRHLYIHWKRIPGRHTSLGIFAHFPNC